MQLSVISKTLVGERSYSSTEMYSTTPVNWAISYLRTITHRCNYMSVKKSTQILVEWWVCHYSKKPIWTLVAE